MAEVPETHQDLVDDSSLMGVLATNGPDGRPQLTALGFSFLDGAFRMCVSDARHKFKNLARDPHCTLFVMDAKSPYRTIEIRGTAELIPDDDYEWAGRISAKYGSSAEHVRELDSPGNPFHVDDARRYCVTLHPTRINSTGGTTGKLTL
jgi:PPOX class probable F420-dependent enzyme